DEDAEDDHHARGGDGAVARITTPEERDDVTPLSERVEQHQRKTGVRAVGGVLLPFGFRELDDERAEDEGDADPTEDAENSLRHGQPLHRSTSTDRAVRN